MNYVFVKFMAEVHQTKRSRFRDRNIVYINLLRILNDLSSIEQWHTTWQILLNKKETC